LSDARLDPLEGATLHPGEQVFRLPDAWCCYAPIEAFPEVSPLPAERTPAVTFGSLHQFRKISDPLLHCWADLLEKAPHARLLMICPPGRAQERVRSLFSRHGIAPERLELIPPCSWADYVTLYEQIDIALDSFPCSGITITCHSLWMGVPVVTLTGQTPVSRGGHSVLHAAGLADWVAADEAQYIRLAADWASDLPRLAGLRHSLRGRMQASPLMDAAKFARNIEDAYRTMWRRWCAEIPCPRS
jgi:predicted O-linked N-acetylglucosamine transferase (SPINDLY family)